MVLNNKILRVLQMQPCDVHTVQLYKKYNTLPIPELQNYQILLLVHKLLYHSNKLPAAFDGYQLKQIRSPNSFKLQLKNYLLNKIC